jgi:hypothetical protein
MNKVGIEADRNRRLKYSKSAKGKRERAEQRKRQNADAPLAL